MIRSSALAGFVDTGPGTVSDDESFMTQNFVWLSMILILSEWRISEIPGKQLTVLVLYPLLEYNKARKYIFTHFRADCTTEASSILSKNGLCGCSR